MATAATYEATYGAPPLPETHARPVEATPGQAGPYKGAADHPPHRYDRPTERATDQQPTSSAYGAASSRTTDHWVGAGLRSDWECCVPLNRDGHERKAEAAETT